MPSGHRVRGDVDGGGNEAAPAGDRPGARVAGTRPTADLAWRGGEPAGTATTLSDQQECAGREGSGMRPSYTTQH